MLESVNKSGCESEKFLWDGLALIGRGNRLYINEPAVTGGNAIMSDENVLLNDMLGSTIGVYGKEYQAVDRSAFGETSAKSDIDFFTGKPNVEGLGYSFLFRNYRQDLGKWQTSDPLGYPDGWNNLAYVNNNVTQYIDWQGTEWKLVIDNYNSLFPVDYFTTWAKGMSGGVTWRRGYHFVITNISEGAAAVVESGTTKTETSTVTFTEIITTTDYFMDGEGNVTSNPPVTYSPTTVNKSHIKAYRE